ncbi:hypothetical protein [Cellulophaga baltica]|jgi:hypothetical protein|uniref:Uncharacterized protein n=2 Tax=Cellulophaga baltica TaxID=76594 RepID=A0A1G7EHX0_9FLAO|nr:hypothetical protein [Cellulophaga baltica]AIZ40246.1 hypothetical protein M666_00835 [Cellulophaga baltica 18]MBA6314321.1 hypothetical protein [Cellulophaga baltica]MCR1024457.1 hypothetical protein [Cellulophaga baltica]SDE63045.1 hypothetical protein SAMN04487992_102320 [Cellulophaga baltica]
MVDIQKVIAQLSSSRLRQIAVSIATFFNEIIASFCKDDNDSSGKKVQYIAQRVDGRKVPVNRKL